MMNKMAQHCCLDRFEIVERVSLEAMEDEMTRACGVNVGSFIQMQEGAA